MRDLTRSLLRQGGRKLGRRPDGRSITAALLAAAGVAALGSIGYPALLSAASAGYGYGYGYGYEYDTHLIVVKHVVNDNGRTATASQFTMTINGVTAQGGNSFPGSEAGTDKIVTPGSYSVTETGPSGYSATFSADCSGSIAQGQTKTCTVTNDDQLGPPTTLTLEPPNAVNVVGTTHTVTATVRDDVDNPLTNVTVRFTVTGSVNTTGQCATDSSGRCTFSYPGPPLPGSDLISAFADSNTNGVPDAGEPTAWATKTWVFPPSTPGHVTGGGQITVGGQRITFSVEAKSDGQVNGNCNVLDHGTSRHIKCTDVAALVVSGNEAWVYGHAQDGGTTTTYVIHIVDNGEPGIGRDTFSILTGTGYSKSGALTAGNIQVRAT